jgi:hypothetical protein
MDLIVLDHETYYDSEYSLSKMSTEDYVTDGRFQSMLVSIKRNDDPVIWYSGTEAGTKQWLHDQRINEAAVACHNHTFDGLVNLLRHDLLPKVLFCTRYMAKPLIQPYVKSVSLGACLKYIGAPVTKGDYVAAMKGRRRESLSRSELAAYAQYCCDDTEGGYHLFKWLIERLPRDELAIIDMTLRMYLQPALIADGAMFERVRDQERAAKEALLAKLPEDVQRADLMSNPRFAQVLQSLGIDPPMKISPTTGKATWAFAKNDPEWKDLEEELADDSIVGPILAARVGTKSTIAETRAERLRVIGERHKYFRVPLVYYAAHTGRYGGTEKINAQNLTRVKRNKDGTPTTRDQLRFGLKAPKGHSVIAVDAAQIEARMNAWLSGCNKLVEEFRQKKDVYSTFASRVFNKPVSKKDPSTERERFVGKTCILGLGYGMGYKKLRTTLRKDDIIVSEAEAGRYVDIYRHEYREIPDMWNFCDQALDVLCNGGKVRIGPCIAQKGKIVLPNGLALHYPNLKFIQTEKYEGWTCLYAGRVKTLWGGKIVENIVQALARIKITEAMREARKELGLCPVLQAHDELVYVAPTVDAPALLKELIQIVSRPSAWSPDIPLSADGGYGPTYGDCK